MSKLKSKRNLSRKVVTESYVAVGREGRERERERETERESERERERERDRERDRDRDRDRGTERRWGGGSEGRTDGIVREGHLRHKQIILHETVLVCSACVCVCVCVC